MKTFSVMLIAPSWGGMINGLLTLRGAWDKVRTDPVLKFMVVAITPVLMLNSMILTKKLLVMLLE